MTDNHFQNIDYELVRLTADEKKLIGGFCCGNETIDTYLKDKAIDDDAGRTYLFVRENVIVGFFTLSCSGLTYKNYNSLQTFPAIEIRYFAVHKKYQKYSISELSEDESDPYYLSDQMLCDTISYCKIISEELIAAQFILLYSVEYAVKFYKRNLFEPFREDFQSDQIRFLEKCTPMFMPLYD